MSIRIKNVDCQFQREPLVRPIGYKGGFMTRIWQVVARLECDKGFHGMGVGTQNVLRTDEEVFAMNPESGGNTLMYAVTSYALSIIRDMTFDNPVELQEKIFDQVYKYARQTTNRPALKKSFVLSALSPIDAAAWVLYSRRNGFQNFDQMIMPVYRPAFANRQCRLASMPVAGLFLSPQEIEQIATETSCHLMKIRLGSPGSNHEMLRQDISRLSEIHRLIGNNPSEHTSHGKIAYCIDLNGRYSSLNELNQLIEHARKIGALEQIEFFEDPFASENMHKIGRLDVRVSANDSLYTAEDIVAHMEKGYSVIALNPSTKTLSMTLKMALEAQQQGLAVYCADSTSNPLQLGFSMQVAGRLNPLPELDLQVLEFSGRQYYRNWDVMCSYHPDGKAGWNDPKEGFFTLNEEFFRSGGGILKDSLHYSNLLLAD